MDAKFRKLCIDAYRGVPTAFAEGNPTDVIVNRIKEANNGSTTLDYKAIRDGKCPELFAVIEELVEIALDAAILENNQLSKKSVEYDEKSEKLRRAEKQIGAAYIDARRYSDDLVDKLKREIA